MSSQQVHEAQETLSGLSLEEVRRREDEAKKNCATQDEYGGEFFNPDESSLSEFLAAQAEAAWCFEVS